MRSGSSAGRVPGQDRVTVQMNFSSVEQMITMMQAGALRHGATLKQDEQQSAGLQLTAAPKYKFNKTRGGQKNKARTDGIKPLQES